MAISMEQKITNVILVAPVFETSPCDQHMASIGNIWEDLPVQVSFATNVQKGRVMNI